MRSVVSGIQVVWAGTVLKRQCKSDASAWDTKRVWCYFRLKELDHPPCLSLAHISSGPTPHCLGFSQPPLSDRAVQMVVFQKSFYLSDFSFRRRRLAKLWNTARRETRRWSGKWEGWPNLKVHGALTFIFISKLQQITPCPVFRNAWEQDLQTLADKEVWARILKASICPWHFLIHGTSSAPLQIQNPPAN